MSHIKMQTGRESEETKVKTAMKRRLGPFARVLSSNAQFKLSLRHVAWMCLPLDVCLSTFNYILLTDVHTIRHNGRWGILN
jgi:hypothetical protein